MEITSCIVCPLSVCLSVCSDTSYSEFVLNNRRTIQFIIPHIIDMTNKEI